MGSRSGAVRSAFRLNVRILSLATLALLVFTLAVLQYRWISQVSDARETMAKSRLREEAKLLANSFDTEVTRATMVFEILPGPMVSRFGEMERVWKVWERNALWPRIVSGIALVESSDAGWRTQWLGKPGVSDVRSILPVRHALSGPPRTLVYHGGNRELFFDGQPAFLRTGTALSRQPGSFQISYVLIRFDQDHVKSAVLPELLEEFTTAEGRAEFQFEIVPKDPARPEPSSSLSASARERRPATEGVITVDLFHYRPDCLPRRPFVPTATPGHMPGLMFSFPGVPHHLQLPGTTDQSASMDAWLKAAGHCHTGPSPSDAGLLQLVVRRRNSWRDVYTGFRWRNLFMSGVVLAALLAAMSAVIVSAERARRLARLQALIAAGISHELRTPLASLRVAADDLKSGHVENAGQARQYGEIIDAQSRRLGHVVDQAFLLASPTESNGSPCGVPVPEILNAAIDALASRISEAQIEVEKGIAPGVPRILADPELVLRCLTNLIENAIKYAGDGRRILLSAERGGRHSGRDMVEVTVEDRGPGIREDEAAAVFEPFYRGTTARQSRQTGSGLGLAIVRNTVEAQGGRIELEQAVPQGCKFRLFFPADGPAAARSKESEMAG